MPVIVGGIIEKEGKVLLVQEKQAKCFGKWNIPAGHLEPKESIIQGAIREIKEETGCGVELTGIAAISNRILDDDIFVGIIFTTKLLKENIEIDPNEILDVKWWDINDVLNNMDNQLRNLNFIKQPIKNIKENKTGSIDMLSFL